jgi:peptidyl-prolyl cis-trans isomerase C
MTIRPLLAASIIALTAALSFRTLAKDDAKSVFATVNGKAIPKSRADAMMAGPRAQGQPDSDELRKAVKDNLVRLEVLSQAATKKGIDKNTEVQGALDLARQNVLANAYLFDYAKTHPISDEVIKKEYDAIRAALGDKEYKARHILVKEESEAKDLIAKLKKGDRFEDLAKQSLDPGSKDKGGDLGWASPAAYVKPFAEAMVKLEKGKYTESPVKSDFGWHVIQLDDIKDAKIPTLEEAKAGLANRLRERAVQQHIEELVKAAKID